MHQNKPYNEPLKWKGKKKKKNISKKYFHPDIEAYPSIQTELTRHAQFRDEYGQIERFTGRGWLFMKKSMFHARKYISRG